MIVDLMTKLKDRYSFLLREVKENGTSLFYIGSSLILLAICFGLISSVFDRKRIFPEKKDRYDVTTLYVALVKDICGEESAVRPLSVPKLESCIGKLTNDGVNAHTGWVKMEIPDIDWIFENNRPSFQKRLESASNSRRIVEEIYVNREPSLVVLKIPHEYYSVDIGDENFNVLTFNQAYSSRVCIMGSCSFPATLSQYGSQTFPLITKDKVENVKPVVMLFGHTERAYSINLQDGIFVTHLLNMERIFIFYPVILNFETLSFALSFVGIIFLTLWQVMLWRRYKDYSAFLLFVTSLVFLTITSNTVLLGHFDSNKVFLIYHLSWSMTLAALLSFCVAYTRSRFSIKLRWFVIIAGLIFALSCIAEMIRPFGKDTSSDLNISPIYALIMLFPPIIVGLKARALHVLLLSQKLDEAEVLAIEQRRNQNIIFCMLFLALFLGKGADTVLLFMGYSSVISDIGPNIVMVVVFMMIFLFHPQFLKIKKLIGTDFPISTVAKMQILLSRSAFNTWLSQKRSGFFIEVDLTDSVELTAEHGSLIHGVMNAVDACLMNDMARSKISTFLRKPLGDARLTVCESQNLNSEELNRYINFLRQESIKYNDLVNRSFSDVTNERNGKIKYGIHINLYCVRDFTLGLEEETSNRILADNQIQFSSTKGGNHDATIDFISNDTNIIMKYAGKAPLGFIRVTGPIKDLPSDLLVGRKIHSVLKTYVMKLRSKGCSDEEIIQKHAYKIIRNSKIVSIDLPLLSYGQEGKTNLAA